MFIIKDSGDLKNTLWYDDASRLACNLSAQEAEICPRCRAVLAEPACVRDCEGVGKKQPKFYHSQQRV